MGERMAGRPFVERWSEEWVAGHDPTRGGPLAEEVVRHTWLGFAPADEARVPAAEPWTAATRIADHPAAGSAAPLPHRNPGSGGRRLPRVVEVDDLPDADRHDDKAHRPREHRAVAHGPHPGNDRGRPGDAQERPADIDSAGIDGASVTVRSWTGCTQRSDRRIPSNPPGRQASGPTRE
ncbi:hypothetical protein ACFRCG_03490 [Embleya sp. NPDC056575]|uniref:hypothetical protein n=1 Tax=unclassified Embleya TaxID=2699296 RepID=UPI0036A11086